MAACRHGKYTWKADIFHLNSKELGVNQPVLKVKLFSRLCDEPCYFRGSEEFSFENPSVGAEHVVAMLPFCYPGIDEDRTVVPPDEPDDDDNHENHTIH